MFKALIRLAVLKYAFRIKPRFYFGLSDLFQLKKECVRIKVSFHNQSQLLMSFVVYWQPCTKIVCFTTAKTCVTVFFWKKGVYKYKIP